MEKVHHRALKDLSVTLFYPAVLGGLIYEAFKLLYHSFTYQCSEGLVIHANWFVFEKLILLFETIAFYSCDFLGACYTKIYTKWSFASDLGMMLIVGALIFKAFRFGEESNSEDNSTLAHFSLIIFCVCFVLFMLVYLAIYLIEKRHDETVKAIYKELAIIEVRALIFFSLIGLANLCLHIDQACLLLFVIMALFYLVGRYWIEIKRLEIEFEAK